ncbi:AAA family ATPase [Candidatus Photodesmus blepharus]|uniref:AAA family ATPase n=1 Tax=Candidatus Photodesmus blepharonis TaxID=1179155 RepID=UPI000699176A|nr:AAA family ATPase [Candidatus Photodesmus blepharus]
MTLEKWIKLPFLKVRTSNLSDFNLPPKYTLRGLLQGHIGMMIAAPDVGKSHLMLSVAIEHASSCKLVGLSAQQTPKKTLYITTEDSIEVVVQRLKEKASILNELVLSELDKFLDIAVCKEPFVIPPGSPDQVYIYHERLLVSLKQMFSEYSLVILDTVTEAIGECDEVKDDRKIKNTFNRLASESGASIILVHHVNKSEIHGLQKITMASGAGLTSIMRLTKFLISMSKKDESLSLQFLKANYLSKEESKNIPLDWYNNLLVAKHYDQVSIAYPELRMSTVHKKRRKISKKVKIEPDSITLGGIDDANNKKDEDMRNVL